jgi:hypothetical protein
MEWLNDIIAKAKEHTMKGSKHIKFQIGFPFALAIAGLVFQAAVFRSEAQITLVDGNSVALLDPASQAGM